jgi:hypothetical protein
MTLIFMRFNSRTQATLTKVGIIALVCFTLAEPAWAWAPATHLFFAKEALRFSHLLPRQLALLLNEYRPDFLYGCMAADITIGKAYVEYIYNCHNFDVGFSLLRHTHSDAERAFVNGYLSHLAADTVAHNFFVPYQNIEHFAINRFRHAYWEVRLDQFFGDRVWNDIESVVRNPRTHSHDQLLDEALRDTIFSFRTNKVLFSSMLAIQRFKKWRLLLKGLNRRSSMQFNPHHLAEYNRLAVSAIIRLLSEGKNSVVYTVDPTGCKTLEEANMIRKMLKQLKKERGLTKKVHEEECQRFRGFVRKQFFAGFPIDAQDFHPNIHMAV